MDAKEIVTQIDPDDPKATVCGHCGKAWDDSISTSMTPAPSRRCPFEYDHEYEEEEETVTIPKSLLREAFGMLLKAEDIGI